MDMPNHRKFLKEVEGRLLSIQPTHKPERWLAKNYIGGSQSSLQFLDIKIPLVRQAFKKGFSFTHLPPEEQWPIWDFIWNQSRIFEVMLLPSYWAATRPVSETLQHHKLILGWLARVDNWAHSDELSSHYARMLEHDPQLLLPVFKKWNGAKNPWVKRQSMVGLLYYSRSRKKKPPVKTLLDSIERHIEDENYYVQKGVGWALREAWNVYPGPTYTYLRKNAGRIPPAGWTAATEKLSPAEKKDLSQRRAATRNRKPSFKTNTSSA